MSALEVRLRSDTLRIGPFTVSFQRTLRIPDDGNTYPLPPGLGRFPLRMVAAYEDTVPEAWRERGGVFLPIYQREAMWLSFEAPYRTPVAVQVGAGKVDALTGEAWREELIGDPQNYLVCPDQPWLDGIHAGEGFIRQFVAMPLGSGTTIEGQITGEEAVGGLQLRAVATRPDWSPPELGFDGTGMVMCMDTTAEMGLAAGGRMRQKVYPDLHGLDVWDEERSGRVFVHLANSETWHAITGEAPPPTPISAKTYTEAGLPWFDLYDDHLGDIEPSEILANVKSVDEIESELSIPKGQMKKLGTAKVQDGEW